MWVILGREYGEKCPLNLSEVGNAHPTYISKSR